MRAFQVFKGTPVKVLKKGRGWIAENFEDRTMKKDQMFFLEDIVADPLGHVGQRRTEDGSYGFKLTDCGDYEVLLVAGNRVRVA